MTHNQKLQAVREAIVAAVPQRKWRYTCDHCQCGTIIEENPALEDVLRTMQKASKTTKIVIDDYGVWWDLNTLQNTTLSSPSSHWEMGLPLDQQSPETVAFLYQILVENI